LGDINTGDRRGRFLYSSDQNITKPAIVPGDNGGQALGGSPFDVFVGGDTVTLTVTGGSTLRAFGADFLYAPSFDTIPENTYRLGIADGPVSGHFAGNLDTIDPNGGTFFLGIIVDPGFEFTRISLFSVPPDPNFVVPAHQIDNLIYAGNLVASVPEPGTLTFLALGTLSLAACLRRRTKPNHAAD